MNISPVVLAIVIAAFAGLSFTGGFAVSEWRSKAQIQRSNQEAKTEAVSADTVEKLPGYGTRNLKYGYVNHQSDYDRERAAQFLRELNKESVYVKQGEPEYELVELFYRRVE